ncbi:hypothetical protein EON65_58155, partial [archaeon]
MNVDGTNLVSLLFVGVLFTVLLSCVHAQTQVSIHAGLAIENRIENRSPAELDRLVRPCGVHADNAGNYYVADPGSFSIRLLSGASGILSIYAGSRSGSYANGAAGTSIGMDTGLWAITGDTQGRIYYSETSACRVRVLAPSTIVVQTVAGVSRACFRSGDGEAASAA